jgi:hypothetical protein
VSDAENIRQRECLDDAALILGKILEVIALGCRLVAVAMAAAVESIDGVAGGGFACDLIPATKPVPCSSSAAGLPEFELPHRASAIRSLSGPTEVRWGLVTRAMRYRASSRIIAAAFSAIIAVGVLVLPEVMVGMTDASATRSPARP